MLMSCTNVFALFGEPLIVEQDATGPYISLRVEPRKVHLNYASNIQVKRFRAVRTRPLLVVSCVFSHLFFLFLFVSRPSSSFLPLPQVCSVYATWKPASYLSDPKQIFHGSIQFNLTQWGYRNQIKGALWRRDPLDRSTRFKLDETGLSTSPR